MPAPLLTTYSPFMLPEGVAGEYAHSPPKSPAKAMMPVLLCSVRRRRVRGRHCSGRRQACLRITCIAGTKSEREAPCWRN